MNAFLSVYQYRSKNVTFSMFRNVKAGNVTRQLTDDVLTEGEKFGKTIIWL
jgi:hypothetical protein